MLNNSIGAPTPKSHSVESSSSKTPIQLTNFSIPEWVHCEFCKRRDQRLPLAYSHPCGHIICRDCCKQTNHCKCSFLFRMIFRDCSAFFLGVFCSKPTQIYPINSNVKSKIFRFFSIRFGLVTSPNQSFVSFALRINSSQWKSNSRTNDETLFEYVQTIVRRKKKHR